MKVLNDVLEYPLKIYQNQNWFCFSIDSIVLANFARIRSRTKKILELGCGNGVVSLILSLRTTASIDGVEIQKDLFSLAEDSVRYNCKENQISIYHMDIKDFAKDKDHHNCYDFIVSNPPYFKIHDKSAFNEDIHKVIARHEFSITLEEIISSVFYLLKEGGGFGLVLRVDRFMEVIFLLQKYCLEVKYIRFVYDHISISPNLFYVEAMKNGKSGLIVDKPFIMYDEMGIETEEYQKMKKEVM